jgi:hypothetical protein
VDGLEREHADIVGELESSNVSSWPRAADAALLFLILPVYLYILTPCASFRSAMPYAPYSTPVRFHLP